MKSLTLLAIAAFTCVVSAQNLDRHNHGSHGDHEKATTPAPVPATTTSAALDYEIQTKPPVVVLTTITKTRPFAVVHGNPTESAMAAAETTDDTEETAEGNEQEGEEDDEEEEEAPQAHGRTRVRQKAVQDVKKDETKSAETVAVEATTPEKAPENHLAAAAATPATTTAARPAASSKPAVRSASSSRAASSASDQLRVGGTFVATAAGVVAWLLI